MGRLSTHVLDTARGVPAEGVGVRVLLGDAQPAAVRGGEPVGQQGAVDPGEQVAEPGGGGVAARQGRHGEEGFVGIGATLRAV